jgi:NAD(P)-dependent dehydrogenase (short-subunit alcohol dehydrogenase family)
MSQRLSGKTALITGASRGLGAAIARAYAKEGAHVILLARTQGALEEIDDSIKSLGGDSTLVVLDLKKPNDIESMSLSLFQRFKSLDIVVGNAAILGGLGPVSHFSVQDYEAVMAVNLYANWRLIRSLEPLLRQSDAGRAIFVTDRNAQKEKPFWGLYSASKAGLERIVQSWALEIAAVTNIRANLIDPGPMRTKLRSQAFPGEKPEKVREPDELQEIFIHFALSECQKNGMIIDFEQNPKFS